MVSEIVGYIYRELGSYSGAAIGALLVYTYHKLYQLYLARKSKKLNSIPRLIQTDIEVYQFLTELLVSSGADRAFIMLFHNGQFYGNNISQTKFSCTHEVVKAGISKEYENMQDLLLSRFSKHFSEILSKKHVKLRVANDDDSYFVNILRRQGVDKCLISALKDDNTVEGFIAIAYNENSWWGEITEQEKELTSVMLEETAAKIGFILRNRK